MAAALLASLAACSTNNTPADAATDVANDLATTLDVASTDDATDVPGDMVVDAPPPPLPPCGTDSPEALMACAERARYVTDLTFIADVRPPGSPHWQEVQDLCATRLTDLGYTVERQMYATGVNVIGVKRGTTTPDEQVLISAHYDHIAGCPGADDNGSGMAGLLEEARVLAMRPHARTLVVACWDEEERGLIGSAAYAQRARAQNDTIVAAFVNETMGYASSEPNTQQTPRGLELLFRTQVNHIHANMDRGDFLTVVLDPASHAAGGYLATYARAVGLPIELLEVQMALLEDPALSDLRRSDHASFWHVQYPGAMLTDTANFRNPHYHCFNGADTVDTLDHDFATKIVRATIGAAARTLTGP